MSDTNNAPNSTSENDLTIVPKRSVPQKGDSVKGENEKFRLSDTEDMNVPEYQKYDKPITVEDIEEIRNIGKKSINEFTPEDIQKSQKWAYKFWNEFKKNGVSPTKSPFFRAWFGDWRQYDTKTRLDFIPVNNEKISAQDVSREGAVNKDTGWDIKVNANSIGETASKNNKNSLAYHSLKNINEMLENAILLDTVSVNKTSTKMDKTAAFMHHLYCRATRS